MLEIPIEIRIFAGKETFFKKYINAVLAGDIKNLTIKEEWIMLEELKQIREELVLEVEKIKQTDLEAIKNERFEAVKQAVSDEVVKEYNEKLAAAELKVQHYDFVIEMLEEKEKEKLEAEIAETNDEQNTEYNEVQ